MKNAQNGEHKCIACGETKPNKSFHGPDTPKCRSCILKDSPCANRTEGHRRRNGTRVVAGKQFDPQAQIELRKKAKELGGKFLPTDVAGMVRFVSTHETRTNVLEEAQKLVDGDRRDDYGHPAENHARTAQMWSAFLGLQITPRQVCMMNILQKCARDAHVPIHDTLVDIAGYARNAQLCTKEEYEPESGE